MCKLQPYKYNFVTHGLFMMTHSKKGAQLHPFHKHVHVDQHMYKKNEYLLRRYKVECI